LPVFCLHTASYIQSKLRTFSHTRQFIPSNKYLSSRSNSFVVVAVVRPSHNLTRLPSRIYPAISYVSCDNPTIAEMFGRSKSTAVAPSDSADSQNNDPLAEIPKTRWERLWPAMACGSGLFSDGYINNVCSSVAQS
jgi:hypothetical protein